MWQVTEYSISLKLGLQKKRGLLIMIKRVVWAIMMKS